MLLLLHYHAHMPRRGLTVLFCLFFACGNDEYTSSVVTISAEMGVQDRATEMRLRVVRVDDESVAFDDSYMLQGDEIEATFPFRVEIILDESTMWRLEVTLSDTNGPFRHDSEGGTQIPGTVQDEDEYGIEFIDRPTQVVAGGGYTCVLREEELECFGSNNNGIIGDGCAETRCPQSTSILGNYESIAGFRGGVCATDTEDRLLCWGDGPESLSVSAREPTVVEGTSPSSQVSFTAEVRCAVHEGALECASTESRFRPRPFGDGPLGNPLPTVFVTQVAVGRAHACALDDETQVHCWGANVGGALGGGDPDDEEPRIVDVGYSHISVGSPIGGGEENCGLQSTSTTSNTCGIRGRELVCWGYNSDGMLGSNMVHGCLLEPTRVSDETGWSHVDLGRNHGCGIRDEQVYCWGNNERGQCGRDSDAETLPIGAVEGLPERDFISVSSGTTHSCAVASDGSVYCWGFNREAQLGDEGQFETGPVIIQAASEP